MTRILILLAAMPLAPLPGAQAHSAAVAAAPMTAVGLPLPLRGTESIIRTANGCGFIDLKPPTADAIANMAKETWYGACRFGLANGRGILQSGANFYVETSYRYGVGRNGKQISWYKDQGGWHRDEYEVYNSPGREDSLYYSDWTDDPDPLNSSGLPTRYRTLNWQASPTLSYHYSDALYWCTGQSQVDAKDLQHFPASEQSLVASQCSDQWAKFRYVKFERWESLPNSAKFPDGQTFHTLETHGSICASMRDCAQAWRNALAPQSAEIERTKTALIAAQESYVADLESRLGPLENAYSAKLRRLMASHSTTAKRTSKSTPRRTR